MSECSLQALGVDGRRPSSQQTCPQASLLLILCGGEASWEWSKIALLLSEWLFPSVSFCGLFTVESPDVGAISVPSCTELFSENWRKIGCIHLSICPKAPLSSESESMLGVGGPTSLPSTVPLREGPPLRPHRASLS